MGRRPRLGLVAHCGGDIFLPLGELWAAGSRELHEDHEVVVSPAEGRRQGLFLHVAEAVRPR